MGLTSLSQVKLNRHNTVGIHRDTDNVVFVTSINLTPNPSTLEKFSKDDILAYGKLRYRRIQYLSEQFG